MITIESKTNKEAIDSIYKNSADGDWVIDLKPGYTTQYGTTYIKNKYKKDCLEELKDIVKDSDLKQKQENFDLFKEAYELHDTLNSKLFDLETSKLKPEVLEKLLQISEEFLKSIDPLTLSIADIRLVGSNASFNYNEQSDIDLHIIVNFDLNYIDDEILQSIYNDKKNKFNEKFDFKIYDIPVEVYIEDIKSMNATNGIYSILRNDWIRKPQPIEYELPDYSEELSWWKTEVNQVLLSGDSKLIEETINEIYMMRKDGLANEGEASIGNLVFKELRNLGLLDGLRNKYCELISNELSLKESLITESYRDENDYQETLKELSKITKQINELSDKLSSLENEYPSDEEMRIACDYSKEEWSQCSKYEKQANYELFGKKSNDEEQKQKERYELSNEITELKNKETELHNKLKELNDNEFQKQGGNTYKNNMPKEYTNSSNKYFNLYTNEYHQDYLDLDYAKEHGYNGCFIASMSPDEYMDRCSKQIFSSPIEDVHDGMENKDNVHKYAELMKNGTKFDMPYLDILNHSQEGRHRAMAAKELGIKEIPVLYLY